jgi:hypothetical protein
MKYIFDEIYPKVKKKKKKRNPTLKFLKCIQ